MLGTTTVGSKLFLLGFGFSSEAFLLGFGCSSGVIRGHESGGRVESAASGRLREERRARRDSGKMTTVAGERVGHAVARVC